MGYPAMIPPIPPAVSTLGAEAQIGSIGGLGAESQIGASGAAESSGFASMVGNQLQNLNSVQAQSDSLQQAMAAGESVDVTQVAVAAERAQLSMQLATQMRNQIVNAYTELMRTQI